MNGHGSGAIGKRRKLFCRIEQGQAGILDQEVLRERKQVAVHQVCAEIRRDIVCEQGFDELQAFLRILEEIFQGKGLASCQIHVNATVYTPEALGFQGAFCVHNAREDTIPDFPATGGDKRDLGRHDCCDPGC